MDAADEFVAALRGVTSPERKRKIIGALFIEIFDREAEKLGGVAVPRPGDDLPRRHREQPGQGPVRRSSSRTTTSAACPRTSSSSSSSRSASCSRTRSARSASSSGSTGSSSPSTRSPGRGWPSGSWARSRAESLAILREADEIVLEEVRRAGVYHQLWQAFAVLLPVRSVGVMGDQRTYQQVVVLRLVQSVDGMTANWYPASPDLLARISTRIVNEVRGVNRVVYDITTKPPGTIEWE